ncbi:MAG: DUF6364 family protein [Bacteroidetes bacterium]|nr:DUF6364 family protein [Bacteroidota bacterium]
MNTKLTLTIDQSIIESAKAYAKAKGRSLSGLIENYLKVITSENKIPDSGIAPLTNSLKGSFKAPEGFDYKIELAEELSKKYLS